jgi:predicted N-acetyltransferase YhbS
MRYRFKRAETEAELEQVFRLNHAVFAGELGQHERHADGQLVDKFHQKNTYLIALSGEQVVGMIALHDQAPFSVSSKLADPTLLEGYGKLVEVRLLAVEPAHRNGLVMAGLMTTLYQQASAYDAIAISGHVDKSGIYHELGFRDLGPAVQSGEAWYVPMILRVEELAERAARWTQRVARQR